MTAIPEKVKKDKAEAEAQRDQILRGKTQKEEATKEVTSEGNEETAKEVPSAEANKKAEPKQEAKAQEQAKDSEVESNSIEAELRKEVERLRKEQQRIAGQLGSEVQKWREQLNIAMTDNLDLAKQLQEAKSSEKVTASKAESKADLNPTKYLTDEEKADYEGMVNVISKVSRAVFESMGGSMEQPVNELKKKVDNLTVEQVANKFVDSVEALAKGFRAANGVPDLGIAPQDQEWIAYLSTPNEITGKTLGQDIMEIVDNAGRVRAAANAFNSYLKTKTVAASRPAATEDAVPQRRKSASASTTVDPKARTTGPKTYTGAEYDKAMEQVRTLGISSEQGRALYEELAKAAREGRVRLT